MDEENVKKIRFIDSEYNTLFYLPDGGNIVITSSDSEKLTRACKFLDEYHTQIGSNVYHICEFAEKMERNGNSYAPEKPPELPALCYSTLPSSGELIVIEKDKKGYGKCGFSSPNSDKNRMMADKYNNHAGVTWQQEAAMVGGSMFGWGSPAGMTSSYDFRGDPIKPAKVKQPRQRDLER